MFLIFICWLNFIVLICCFFHICFFTQSGIGRDSALLTVAASHATSSGPVVNVALQHLKVSGKVERGYKLLRRRKPRYLKRLSYSPEKRFADQPYSAWLSQLPPRMTRSELPPLSQALPSVGTP